MRMSRRQKEFQLHLLISLVFAFHRSPEPADSELWTDIYYKGTEPDFMRGREKEEIHRYR